MEYIGWVFAHFTIEPSYDPWWLTIIKFLWWMLIGHVVVNLFKPRSRPNTSPPVDYLLTATNNISGEKVQHRVDIPDLEKVYYALKEADICFTDMAILKALNEKENLIIPCNIKHYYEADCKWYKPALYECVVRSNTKYDHHKDYMGGFAFDQAFVIYLCKRNDIYEPSILKPYLGE